MAKLFESISCSVLAFSVLFNPTVILCPFVSFSKRGFSVRSFETGTHVKLPGPAPDKPNVYDFKTTYDQMYNDLLRKDKELHPNGCPLTPRACLWHVSAVGTPRGTCEAGDAAARARCAGSLGLCPCAYGTVQGLETTWTQSVKVLVRC